MGAVRAQPSKGCCWGAQDAGGCQGHPTAETHAAWSGVVQGLVGNLTGWSTADTQTSFLPRADGGR